MQLLRRASAAASASAVADASDELEFGGDAARSEADGVESARERGAVRDHPDFAFLAAAEAVARLPALPYEPDARKWRVLEVRLRPDRAWDVMRELLVTVCMAKGLVVAEETPASVLFRKKVSLENGGGAALQHVFVRVGVLPSKLRVLHVCCLVTGESKLLGALVPGARAAAGDWAKPLALALDQLLGAIQATVVDQCLSLSHLFMATPEKNAVDDVTGAELDPGYVLDVKRMFASEMKANMRELCIPLEEFAYEQEFACALLIGLLDPLYKKYGLKIAEEPAATSGHTSLAAALSSASLSGGAAAEGAAPRAAVAGGAPQPAAGKCYGEVINDLVHALWKALTAECERKVATKIDEKQKQVAARADAAQRLRVRAIATLMEHPDAEVTSLKPTTPGGDKRPDVLLYEGSSVINTIPSRLHVTFRALIYRTMVPLIATTTVVPFDDVASVMQTTMFGIRVVSVELRDRAKKPVTIATGLEVDLLYQLLAQVLTMHTRQAGERPRTWSGLKQQQPQQQEETDDAALLHKLLSADDDNDGGEEEKTAEADDDADEETDVAFKRALEQSEAFA
ncbi:hypothetical protein PybrP1_011675 [[Pythium] brassicae (nom. inval.)]|nr:hypothetical protein PybrP1_011675 [[Pythium] brassicae (nom. inval.)]